MSDYHVKVDHRGEIGCSIAFLALAILIGSCVVSESIDNLSLDYAAR